MYGRYYTETLPTGKGAEVKSLQHLCLEQILLHLDFHSFNPRLLNKLCKYLPPHICEPILEKLLELKLVTDSILIDFLNPARTTLRLQNVSNLRASTLKQIGFHCPFLVSLDLSHNTQVRNAVVRGILQDCLSLQELRLDGCHRISDSAFDVYESPFQALQGCQSLQLISLAGCNQVTGKLAELLNKNCRGLVFLNLSQCKKVMAPAIKELFNHGGMRYLNISFIEAVDDEAFFHIPTLATTAASLSSSSSSSSSIWYSKSPLEHLHLISSTITDATLSRMGFFNLLK